MIMANIRRGGVNAGLYRARTILSFATVLMAVMAIVVIAMGFLRVPIADAHGAHPGNSDGWERDFASDAPMLPFQHSDPRIGDWDDDPMGALEPSTGANHERPLAPTHVDDDCAADVIVWATDLTVGVASDQINKSWGYMLGATAGGNRGNLGDTTFSYDDVEYTVKGLFINKNLISGIRDLYFLADVTLPDNLILQIGNRQYDFADATIDGVWSERRIWRIDDGLGWTNGYIANVGLVEAPAE